MFALTKLLTALSALADNLNALAGTVAEINGGLRGRLALDAPTGDVPVLEDEPAPGNGAGRRKRASA
jgi:hypothetical protein